MLQLCLYFTLVFDVFNITLAQFLRDDVISTKTYAIWKNGTVPFYINPSHFDHEQTTAILTALSTFAYKSCIKFKPVMAGPATGDHVMMFINPDGTRRCTIDTEGHSVFIPHPVRLGYECLRSPQIDMMIMRALGFPFEHNRGSRDLYIDVLQENIEPGALELFTKEERLPLELRFLPYDINSVMHFSDREYSKNGHRTILFKDPTAKQNRVGLTETDIKKIELVYGPECRARDRQEKVDMCQSYPGVARKRRQAYLSKNRQTVTDFRPNREAENEAMHTKSLRINPDITVPPTNNKHDDIAKTLRDLNIEDEVKDTVDKVIKLSSSALSFARKRYCNKSLDDLTPAEEAKYNPAGNNSNLLGVIDVVANFAKSLVDTSINNVTKFCELADTIEAYQRYNNKLIVSGNNQSVLLKPVKHFSTNETTEDVVNLLPTTLSMKRKRELVKQKQITEANLTLNIKKGVNNTDETVKELSEMEKAMFVKRNDYRKTLVRHRKSASSSTEQDSSVEELEKGDGHKKPYKIMHDEKYSNDETSDEIRILNEKSNQGQKHKKAKTKPFTTLIEFESSKSEFDHKDEKHSVYVGRTTNRPKHKSGVKNNEDLTESTSSDIEQETIKRPKKIDRESKHSYMKHSSKKELPRTVSLSKENEEFYEDRRWPDGVLVYVIQEDDKYDLSDMRRRLQEVIDILKEKTCIKMKEVTASEASNYDDYIIIDQSPDYVTGRVGGEQRFGSVELFRGGQPRQHAAMLVMAMLGFYLELARHDRDRHVRVHMRHVRPDKLHHFEKMQSEATLRLPYDYASATHPAWHFWRHGGRTGIASVATYKHIDPDGKIMKSLGQNEKLLSDLDIVKINSVYGVNCFQNKRSKRENLNYTIVG